MAIAIIPLALWLARHGTMFKPDWRVWAFVAGLIFSCLLIPVGTAARTGLVCVAVLGVLMLRTARHKFLLAGRVRAGALAAMPFLPQSYLDRMETMTNTSGRRKRIDPRGRCGNGRSITSRSTRWAVGSTPTASNSFTYWTAKTARANRPTSGSSIRR